MFLDLASSSTAIFVRSLEVYLLRTTDMKMWTPHSEVEGVKDRNDVKKWSENKKVVLKVIFITFGNSLTIVVLNGDKVYEKRTRQRIAQKMPLTYCQDQAV